MADHKNMANHRYDNYIANKPLTEEEYSILVTDRLGLLEETPNGGAEDDHLYISYSPVREDGFISIIVINAPFYDGYWISLRTHTPGNHERIYIREDLTYAETEQILRRILVDYRIPDLNDWFEDTALINYISQSYRIVNEFPGKENPTEEDEFAYVEALDCLIKNVLEDKVEHIKMLAWFYAERRRFDLEKKYLELAFDEGDPDAACELGYMWYYGQHGEVNYEKAYHYFKAGLTNAPTPNTYYCRYKLADMYRYGLHVEQDEQRYRAMIREALEDMGDTPPNLSYPYPELAYRMAGIEADEGNAPEATRLLKKARHFLAERLMRDNYWGSIDIMQRIVRKMYEITPFDEETMEFYDIIRLADHPCRAEFIYDGEAHQIEIAEDGGVALDGKWYRSIGVFLEKCTLGDRRITAIYDEIHGLAVA